MGAALDGRITILHVIRQLTNGGASIGLLNMCVQGPSDVEHAVLSLLPPSEAGIIRFQAAGVPVFRSFLDTDPESFDLIQAEWWNTPEMVRFLLSDLPPCRILLHSRAHFDAPHMCPSATLLQRVDAVTVSTPSSLDNLAFMALAERCGLPETRTVYSGAARRSPGPLPRAWRGRIGYLGTVEGIKMHRRTLPMIAKIAAVVPELEFCFAGEGDLDRYRAVSRELGIGSRVRFLGFVEDPWAFLDSLDVLFYPLNPFTYATSEKAVQEAMIAGVPVAAFASGGLRDLLTPDCSVICNREDALVDRTIALLRNPRCRERLAGAAQRRLADWSICRDWRQDARSAWQSLLGVPKRPRPAVSVRSEAELFVLSHAAEACPPLSGPAEQDRRAVASFVLENYRISVV